MKYRIIHKILSILGIRFLENVCIAPSFVARPSGFEVKILSSKELRDLCDQGVLSYSVNDIARIEEEVAICVVAFESGGVAGICWYARTHYAHTPGYVAYIAEGFLCGYGLRIMPNYRGRGVHGVLVSKALEWAHQNGKKGLLLAINFDNPASIKSALKLGFNSIGYSFYHSRLKGFSKVRSHYFIGAA